MREYSPRLVVTSRRATCTQFTLTNLFVLCVLFAVALIPCSMSAVDDTIAGLADREASSVAGTVKCISCGTNYAPKSRPNGGGGESPERGTRHLSSRGQCYGPSSGLPISAPPETLRPHSMNVPNQNQHSQNQYALSDTNLNGMTAAEYSRMEAEDYLAVIKRQGGLKPLARHTQPLQARANPYHNTGVACNDKSRIDNDIPSHLILLLFTFIRIIKN